MKKKKKTVKFLPFKKKQQQPTFNGKTEKFIIYDLQIC